jgi:hypothetical protein
MDGLVNSALLVSRRVGCTLLQRWGRVYEYEGRAQPPRELTPSRPPIHKERLKGAWEEGEQSLMKFPLHAFANVVVPTRFGGIL